MTASVEGVPAEPAVETARLHKSYGKVQALRGIDLRVETGSVFGLLGPNGAGKTTAVRILTTLLLPDDGSARVGVRRRSRRPEGARAGRPGGPVRRRRRDPDRLREAR